MSENLEELRRRAQSRDWKERARIARELAELPGDEPVALLAQLLNDPEDLAVSCAALHTLIGRSDEKAAETVLRTIHLGGDDLVDQLLDELHDAAPEGTKFQKHARAALHSADLEVATGARKVIEDLGWADGH